MVIFGRLRSSERVARLEVDRVVGLSMADLSLRSLLDIGTGSGLFAEAFAAKGLKASGVDLREDMLKPPANTCRMVTSARVLYGNLALSRRDL